MSSASEETRSVLLLGGFARLLALASQFAALIVLNVILPQAAFGIFMVAYAFFRVAAISIGSGLGNFVLFHVSRAEGNEVRSSGVHLFALSVCVALTVALFGAIAWSGDAIRAVYQSEELVRWMIPFGPYLVCHSISLVSVGYFDGRGQISRSILMSDLSPNLMQISLFLMIYWLNSDVVWIPAALAASYFLPWVYFSLPKVTSVRSALPKITWWDLRYSTSYSFTALVSQQINGLDLLIAGILFPPEQVAIYAICARISLLFPFFQVLLLRRYASVGGALLAQGLNRDFSRGLRKTKRIAIPSTYIILSVFILLSPLIFNFMGLASDGVYILCCLALVYIVRANFSGVDVALKMLGKHHIALLLSVLNTVSLAVGAWLLSDIFDIYSFSVSLTLGSIFTGLLATSILGKSEIRSDSTNSRIVSLFGAAFVIASISFSLPYVAAIFCSFGLLLLALVSIFLGERLD